MGVQAMGNTNTGQLRTRGLQAERDSNVVVLYCSQIAEKKGMTSSGTTAKLPSAGNFPGWQTLSPSSPPLKIISHSIKFQTLPIQIA
jgi:hypothetical protein